MRRRATSRYIAESRVKPGRMASIAALLTMVAACGPFPRDAEGTTERIRQTGQMQAAIVSGTEDAAPAQRAVVELAHGWPPTRKFPYGFKRFNSIAFLISATALLSIGRFMAYEAVTGLLTMEHPSIGAISLFGVEIWHGWVMLAALAYSAVPPVILGRLKKPVAEQIEDKVLFTDAQTQKADWQTALAGIAGVIGIGFGLWWADAAAALFIALSVLRDGWSAIKRSASELAYGAPRALDSSEIDAEAEEVIAKLALAFPQCEIRVRESGRYMIAQVAGPDARLDGPIDRFRPRRRPWRLAEVSMRFCDPGPG